LPAVDNAVWGTHQCGETRHVRAIHRAAGTGQRVGRDLRDRGIIARARGRHELAEEQPAAYKDVALVVEAVSQAGLAKKVARLVPIGVIQG
jgi:tRNA-splicing ligase RtcB